MFSVHSDHSKTSATRLSVNFSPLPQKMAVLLSLHRNNRSFENFGEGIVSNLRPHTVRWPEKSLGSQHQSGRYQSTSTDAGCCPVLVDVISAAAAFASHGAHFQVLSPCSHSLRQMTQLYFFVRCLHVFGPSQSTQQSEKRPCVQISYSGAHSLQRLF